jgi:hypothetical protein
VALWRLNRRLRPYTFRRASPPCRPRARAAIANAQHVTFHTALFWIAAACCVVAELAILRSVFFGRAATSKLARDGSMEAAPKARATELAWALLPAAGLLFILYLTWRAMDPAPVPVRDVSHGGAAIGA